MNNTCRHAEVVRPFPIFVGSCPPEKMHYFSSLTTGGHTCPYPTLSSPPLFLFSSFSLGSVAEFNADSFWHGPVGGKDGRTFVIVIDQCPLEPGIAPVHLVKPRWFQTFMEEHVVISELHFDEPLNQLLPGGTEQNREREDGREGGRKRG